MLQRSSLVLAAKKSSKKSDKKKGRPSSSGFGGAATESCPCGGGNSAEGESPSQLPYLKCCGKIHKNLFEFQKASPEQVVRARYTAYAKREIDFIIKSTHPKNKSFSADIKHWREQIDLNCYDNFELTKCEILDASVVSSSDTEATVTFVANMVQLDSKERTAFQETSTFEKIGGVWMYLEGDIAEPPDREETLADDVEVNDESVDDEGESGVEGTTAHKDDVPVA